MLLTTIPSLNSRLSEPCFCHEVTNENDTILFVDKKKETHIKKPLNAFMLYMKEMRPVVQAECTLKESAAINQLLGRRVSQVRQQVIEDDLFAPLTD